MKNFICTLIFALLGSGIALAQKNYSAGQQAVRDKILSFLKEEGYQPSIDDDGDIKFKRQGDVYFVTVSDNDASPYFVKINKYYGYNDTFTKAKITLYALEVNKYKTIKLMSNDKQYWFESEMFVTNASAFTSVFSRILKAMDAAEEELK